MLTFDDNGKIDILALLPSELESQITQLGEKKFRAKQIFNWLHVKQVKSFDEMTDISAQFRRKLDESFCIKSLFAVKKLESCTDNTVKYLY
ncbi:MAG TPA: 23S rRNA (adenine(2503)-C(2))-methyltransferase RlmN, partial [Clostridiales bacterium]|nr:23S rRNA (adenine(2503)-C(2))-methyltransferase RlmN [Clostridiales bacterium]